MRLLYGIVCITATTFIMGCKQHMYVPNLWVNAGEEIFEQKQGILYCRHQPFSGYQYALYAGGDTAFIMPFYKGRAHGIGRHWYTGRQLKTTGLYINGHKTGAHTGWWENGQQQFLYHYKQDVFNGTVQEWYANGQLFRNMQYTAGHESGLQQIWQPNGKLFANYEARNGRQYGLTGTMHCRNSE